MIKKAIKGEKKLNKKHLPYRKRFAIWRAYDQKCQYCKEPLFFDDLWVEHVIPEHLLNNKKELKKVLEDFDLDENFEINNYGNWIAAHSRCNRDKGTRILDKSVALHFLGIAKEKAQKAADEEEMYIKKRKSSELLFRIKIEIEEGNISEEEIKQIFIPRADSTTNYSLLLRGDWFSKQIESKWNNLIESFARRLFEIRYDPLVITFGLELSNVYEQLPTSSFRKQVTLYDWLENELLQYIASIISTPFYYSEPSSRDGEIISVRMTFPKLNLEQLEKFSSLYWKILEIEYYSEIYGKNSIEP